MFAEGFIVHKEVDGVAVAVDLIDPAGEFFGSQRPFFPIPVSETERDVVAEAIIFKQQFGLGATGCLIEEVRRSSLEDMIGAFADNALEAELRDQVGEIVVVNQFGVAEDLGFLAEVFFDESALEVDLFGELFSAIEERKGMIIGFGEEFDAPCVGKSLEGVEDLWIILLELLDDDAGERIRTAEMAVVLFDQVEHDLIGRKITFVRDFPKNLGIFIFIEVNGVGIEDTVSSKSIRLMDLKIKAYRSHNVLPT
jgi:hypothetical protein